MTAVVEPTQAVTLNLRTYLAACELHGLHTDDERAKAFGVTRQTINAIQSGRRTPSNETIAGVWAFFAARQISPLMLFTVTAPTGQAVAA